LALLSSIAVSFLSDPVFLMLGQCVFEHLFKNNADRCPMGMLTISFNLLRQNKIVVCFKSAWFVKKNFEVLKCLSNMP
jgi:hypothetical protein